MASENRRRCKETVRAHTVLDQTRDSVKGFLGAFEKLRQSRSARGNSTDQEQDLLRAALVFAAAGLDSVAKELIKSCIRALAACDSDVQVELETFVYRKLRGESGEPEALGGARFLAQVLIAKSPQERLIDLYVLELTGSSLQSAEQLMRAAKALGLQPNTIGVDLKELKPIFAARNKIIHELDVNLGVTPARRNQNSRRRRDMEAWGMKLLDIGAKLISGVDQKLRSATQ
jgi:hypothetical protein